MNVTIGSYKFDNVDYDREGDVLYLHRGDPATAVDFDESAEGDGLRFDAGGELVGITMLSARYRLDHDGEISVTIPARHLSADVSQLADALSTAA